MGHLKITNASTGKVVYSTHNEHMYNEAEEIKPDQFAPRESLVKRTPRQEPYQAPGFDLGEFSKSIGGQVDARTSQKGNPKLRR